MKSRYYFVILVVALLVFGLNACTRSKNPSASSVTEPTATVSGDTQPTIDDVMSQLELFVTQTAAATQGLAGETTTAAPEEGAQVTQTDSAAIVEPTATQSVAQPSATPLPTQELAPTAVPVPAATPGIPTSYTLHGGEHVYCISRRFNVNPIEVQSINGLGSGSLVYAGMTLRIPQTGNPFPGNRSLMSHPTTYTVQPRDTIYSVACQFGDVDPYAIAYANGMSEPYKLSVGQTIHIP